MRSECNICHNKTVEKLIAKFEPNDNAIGIFQAGTSKLLEKNYDNPYLATQIHRLARNVLNNDSLYRDEKISANRILLQDYESWRQMIVTDKNPFKKAATMAVAGNIIDYGAHSVPSDIKMQINSILEQELAFDDTALLKKKIQEANSILYLGDNAGEIVFDKLFIELLDHDNVTYVVRDKPVINDVTFDDIEQVNMREVCNVISNGYDAPSTLLDFCSKQFIEAYNSADLIISKGQGNFEGLMNTKNSKIFFLLMAKCNPMAEMLGVKKGDMVVKQLKNIQNVL